MLQPKVRVAVVYVGQNHAQFLSQFLPRQLGFTTHAVEKIIYVCTAHGYYFCIAGN